MKYRPKIGQGDFDTKTRKVEKFLDEGHKVKVTIMFRGREVQHPELGQADPRRRGRDGRRRRPGRGHAPKLDGRNMTMVLAPDKRAQAAAQRRNAESARAERTGAAATCEPPSQIEPSNRDDETTRARPSQRRRATMPKMRTHRGAAKRFKVTGSGKIIRRQANRNHILEKKPSHPDAPARRPRSSVADAEAPRISAAARPLAEPSTRTHRRPKGAPMARVKRAVHSKKHRRATLERAKGYYGNKSRSYARQRAGHALAAVRVPRPPGPQGRLPQALDPADQRRLPAERHQLQPLHQRAPSWPRSRSTARCWPTWP